MHLPFLTPLYARCFVKSIEKERDKLDIKVYGLSVDKMTRCVHYHSDVDIIAIRFYCCMAYYPCYQCHDELAGHPRQVWPKNKFNEKAVLCGSCHEQLTVEEYINCHSVCPYCSAKFNEGCHLHHHLYFEK